MKKLCIPAEWIHAVKATKSLASQKYWVAYTHLSYAENWHDCHDLILQNLMPNLVCNGQFSLLNRILSKCVPAAGGIHRWRFRGGLLMEFINMWQRINDLDEDTNRHELGRHLSDVRTIVKRLKSFAPETPTDYMVVSEVSKSFSHLHETLLKKIQFDEHNFLIQTTELLNLLIMPFDYKYTDLNKCFVLFNKTPFYSMLQN